MRLLVLVSLAVAGWARQPDGQAMSCYDEKDKGKSYTGLMDFTESGRACQNWLVRRPHPISIEPLPGNGLGNHNYCRNPDESEAKPWCYTMDPSPDHVKETCTVSVCKPTRDFNWEAKFLAAKMPDVDVGVFSFKDIDGDGDYDARVRPQFKVGIGMENAKAEVGLDDVRDGLSMKAKASVSVQAKAEGQNVVELNQNIHCDEPGFHDALDAVMELLGNGANSAIKTIAEALGEDPTETQHELDGEANRETDPAKLKVVAGMGVGMSATVKLGYVDTKGYKMVGAGGQAAAAVGLGASVYAGRHVSGQSIKIVFSVGNFMFDYTLPIAA